MRQLCYIHNPGKTLTSREKRTTDSEKREQSRGEVRGNRKQIREQAKTEKKKRS